MVQEEVMEAGYSERRQTMMACMQWRKRRIDSTLTVRKPVELYLGFQSEFGCNDQGVLHSGNVNLKLQVDSACYCNDYYQLYLNSILI